MIQTGTLLNDTYRILSELFYDNISTTHMALNEKMNEICVIKQMKKTNPKTSNSVSNNILSEIETIKNNNHPALQRIIDIVEDENSFLLIMDYVKGDSLDKILKEHGAVSPEFATEIMKQICRILEYFNSVKSTISTKNITPADIIIQPKRNIIILNSATTNMLKQHDDKTEVFCLGSLLFRLLTNSEPDFSSTNGTSVRKLNPSLPSDLDRITAKCLAKKPADQYQTSAELLYDLEKLGNTDNSSQKNKNLKLSFFILSVILTVVFSASAIFCYLLAENNNTKPSDTEQTTQEASSDNPAEEESDSVIYDIISEALSDSETLTMLNSNKGELM